MYLFTSCFVVPMPIFYHGLRACTTSSTASVSELWCWLLLGKHMLFYRVTAVLRCNFLEVRGNVIAVGDNCQCNKRKIYANDAKSWHKHPSMQWAYIRFMMWICMIVFERTIVCLPVLSSRGFMDLLSCWHRSCIIMSWMDICVWPQLMVMPSCD